MSIDQGLKRRVISFVHEDTEETYQCPHCHSYDNGRSRDLGNTYSKQRGLQVFQTVVCLGCKHEWIPHKTM